MLVALGAAILAGIVLCTSESPALQERVSVWIDTDPAVGEPERDVDDGLALLQAFRSPELDIRGVSVVFGNAPLDRGVPIARRLVSDFGPAGLPVVPGAATASAIGLETEATRALAAALRQAPLTVLALGPATNVATVLRNHADLASRIVRIVAVAGRRPGQRFITGATNPRGHRDFNFELDPEAFRVILASGVPLTLTPFEISSKIWIESWDLDRLATASPAANTLAGPAREWLTLWRRLFDVNGFNPFDTLAVGYVAAPEGFECEWLPIAIETRADDVTEAGLQGVAVDTKPYLLASAALRAASTRALYCRTPPPGFKDDLLTRLMR